MLSLENFTRVFIGIKKLLKTILSVTFDFFFIREFGKMHFILIELQLCAKQSGWQKSLDVRVWPFTITRYLWRKGRPSPYAVLGTAWFYLLCLVTHGLKDTHKICGFFLGRQQGWLHKKVTILDLVLIVGVLSSIQSRVVSKIFHTQKFHFSNCKVAAYIFS